MVSGLVDATTKEIKMAACRGSRLKRSKVCTKRHESEDDKNSFYGLCNLSLRVRQGLGYSISPP
jgi:hypothetical protein